MKEKTEDQKTSKKSLSLSEAEIFLRKIGEWNSVSHLNRETIIKWAEYLLSRKSN